MKSEMMDVNAVEQFYEGAQDLFFKNIELELAAATPRMKRGLIAGSARVSDLQGESTPVVVGSSLVLFDEKLTEEDRQIAADCQTFAETLVKRLPADTSVAECYEAYNNALLSTGWYSEGFTFHNFETEKVTLTMNDAVMEILETVVGVGSGNVLSLVASGLSKLKGDAKALKIVETGSKKNNLNSFKAVPCILAPDGGASMVMGALDVMDTKFDGNFLLFSFNTAGVKMFRAAGVRKLNKRLFKRKEEKVYEYIDRFADDLFQKVTG